MVPCELPSVNQIMGKNCFAPFIYDHDKQEKICWFSSLKKAFINFHLHSRTRSVDTKQSSPMTNDRSGLFSFFFIIFFYFWILFYFCEEMSEYLAVILCPNKLGQWCFLYEKPQVEFSITSTDPYSTTNTHNTYCCTDIVNKNWFFVFAAFFHFDFLKLNQYILSTYKFLSGMNFYLPDTLELLNECNC